MLLAWHAAAGLRGHALPSRSTLSIPWKPHSRIGKPCKTSVAKTAKKYACSCPTRKARPSRARAHRYLSSQQGMIERHYLLFVRVIMRANPQAAEREDSRCCRTSDVFRCYQIAPRQLQGKRLRDAVVQAPRSQNGWLQRRAQIVCTSRVVHVTSNSLPKRAPLRQGI
jgi:hypothetical protein